MVNREEELIDVISLVRDIEPFIDGVVMDGYVDIGHRRKRTLNVLTIIAEYMDYQELTGKDLWEGVEELKSVS